MRTVGARAFSRGEFPDEPVLVTHDRGSSLVGLFVPLPLMTTEDFERAGSAPKPEQEADAAPPARTPAPPDQTVAPRPDGGGAARPGAPGMSQAERDRVLAKLNRKTKGER